MLFQLQPSVSVQVRRPQCDSQVSLWAADQLVPPRGLYELVLGARTGNGLSLQESGGLMCACSCSSATRSSSRPADRNMSSCRGESCWPSPSGPPSSSSSSSVTTAWLPPLRALCGAVNPGNNRQLGARGLSPLVRCGGNDARAHLHLPRAARLPAVGVGSDRQDGGKTRTRSHWEPDLLIQNYETGTEVVLQVFREELSLSFILIKTRKY